MITDYSDHITTDKQEQQELVELYNKWYKDTMFLSSWPASNKYWDEMEKYCQSHKDLTLQLWVDMKHDLGTVGHFTYMLQKILPGVLEPQGYIPLNVFEQIWLCTLGAKFEYFQKTLSIENKDEWDEFWKDFKLFEWYTFLDNPNPPKINWTNYKAQLIPRIESIDGQFEDLDNDPKTWEPITIEYKKDWWEEQSLTEEKNEDK